MAVSWISVDDLADPGHPLAPEMVNAASWILFKLTGEKYAGIRSATELHIVTDDELWASASEYTYSAVSTSVTVNYAQSRWLGPCSTTRALRLRGRPVRIVTQIADNTGQPLPNDSYRLVNNAYVVRTDGGPWSLGSGLSVSYDYGILPPKAGLGACVRLANELLLLHTDPKSCSLPERVTSISRQGVSVTVADPQDFLENGRTGIYDIDLFITTANPSHSRKKPRVFSPDISRGER